MSKTGCMKENRAEKMSSRKKYCRVAGMPLETPRLTAEEERELIRIAQSDGPDSDAACDRLWKSHLGFWIRCARNWMPYIHKGYEFDDVFQHVMFAVVRSIKQYDLSQDVRLTSYAKYAIDREVQRLRLFQTVIRVPAKRYDGDPWLEDRARACKVTSADQAFGESNFTIASVLQDESDVVGDVLKNELIEMLHEAVCSIERENWRLIIIRFLEGHHVAEIARQLNVRRQAVDRQLILAKREVHKYLEEHYGDFIRDQFGQDCFNRFLSGSDRGERCRTK